MGEGPYRTAARPEPEKEATAVCPFCGQAPASIHPLCEQEARAEQHRAWWHEDIPTMPVGEGGAG